MPEASRAESLTYFDPSQEEVDLQLGRLDLPDDAVRYNLLTSAFKRDDIELLTGLLRRGVDPNLRDSYGSTAFDVLVHTDDGYFMDGDDPEFMSRTTRTLVILRAAGARPCVDQRPASQAARSRGNDRSAELIEKVFGMSGDC